MLYLPRQFDGNEWFILVSGVISWGAFLWLPKRFHAFEYLTIWIFNMFLAASADFWIAKPPIDLYDFNDYPQYELFDLILYIINYPSAALLFLYFMEKWRLTGIKLVGYTAAFALITVGFEWLSYLFHVYTYKGWKLIYSFPTYMLLYWLNIRVFRFARRSWQAINE